MFTCELEGFSETVCVLSEEMAPHIFKQEHEDTGYHLHANCPTPSKQPYLRLWVVPTTSGYICILVLHT